METKKKNNYTFWLIFSLCILFAAISTIGNLREYRKMDKLENEGKRILAAVDSLNVKGSKHEIFVRFTADGKIFTATKKVQEQITKDDSVPVYYMPGKPEVNAIAVE